MELSFLLRCVACMVLFVLPLCFPHDPWKPEETRLVGQVLHVMDNASPLLFSASSLFSHTISFIASFIPLRLEVIARALSLFILALGGGALYAWARAFQRNYSELLPRSMCSAAFLLLLSSIGLMVWGYQATSESAWFLGTALTVWVGGESERMRRYAIGACAVLWLALCGGLNGMLLAVICAGVLPWGWSWYHGKRDAANRLEGIVVSCIAICLFILWGRHGLSFQHFFLMLDYLKKVGRVLLWYALPIWPLALAVWWRGRQLPERIRVVWQSWRWLPLSQLLIALLLGSRMDRWMWQESHVLMYMPFLVAMGLPALYLVDVRSWFNAVHWFTRSVLILLLGVVWMMVGAMHWHLPFRLYHALEAYQPGFRSESIVPAAWVFSIVLSIYALRYLVVPCQTLRDSLWRWTLGFGCTACVIRLMLVPYIDYGKTYQATFHRLNAVVPTTACVDIDASMGDSQRAMWRYYTARFRYLSQEKNCLWRLEQGYHIAGESMQEGIVAKKGGWILRLKEHRPGDKNEWFLLWSRF